MKNNRWLAVPVKRTLDLFLTVLGQVSGIAASNADRSAEAKNITRVIMYKTYKTMVIYAASERTGFAGG